MAKRIFALAFLLCVPAAFGAGAPSPMPASGSKPEVSRTAAEYKYVGPGSCSATACHGGVQPLALTSVLQNEYSTWAVQDPHAKAYRSLENAVSQRMARILGIGDPTKAQKCLVCHALDASAEQKGRDFDIADGVSCESCHGPASAWLGPHTLKGSSMEKFTGMGMINLKNLERRAEQCNTCHVGTREKEVDHDMIGAGHPDLVFELDSYDAIMPPHWKPAPEADEGIRTWSIGQATYLRDALARLARHAQKPEWPEYSELDCFACHHSLSKPENSWRQDRGYPGRATATPPWNASHYMVFRIVARDLDAASGREMESELDSLYKLMSSRNASKRIEIADTAKRAGELAGRYVEKINQTSFDRART
ncbi:MAG: multiheme c-type cytochrome, partial [Candidatus Acidiferrum sp.]